MTGLEARCREWQRRLRLLDWDVKIEMACPRALGGRVADVSWVIAPKRAVIRIRHAADELELELSLVHELLHLHLAPLAVQDDTPEDLAQETAIEMISRALVALAREAALTSPPVSGCPSTAAGSPRRPCARRSAPPRSDRSIPRPS